MPGEAQGRGGHRQRPFVSLGTLRTRTETDRRCPVPLPVQRQLDGRRLPRASGTTAEGERPPASDGTRPNTNAHEGSYRFCWAQQRATSTTHLTSDSLARMSGRAVNDASSSTEAVRSAPRKILLIAFFYPPSRASGVYRALAIGNYLVDQGHDVTVLTTTRSFFELEAGPLDESLEGRIDPRIKLIRVPFSTRPAHRSIELLSPVMARFRPIMKRLLPRPLRSKLDLLSLRSGAALHPPGLVDRYRSWYGPAVEATTNNVNLPDLDLVIATGNPWTSFAIAHTLASLGDASYVMDYRDPWKIDVRTGQPYLRPAETEALEALLLAGALRVTHPNQHLADRYCEFFPEMTNRVRVMENGFDPETLPALDEMRPLRANASEPLRLGALGTVSDMWPLDEFGEAWLKYLAANVDYRFDLAGHLGWFDSGRSGLAAKLKRLKINYVGQKQRSHVSEFYRSLDAVVMFSWGDSGLTAGKMYEVAAIGLPILCIQPEGGGVRTFLERDHPRAVCVNPEPSEILSGLGKVEQMTREMTLAERASIRTALGRNSRSKLLSPLDEFVAIADAR